LGKCVSLRFVANAKIKIKNTIKTIWDSQMYTQSAPNLNIYITIKPSCVFIWKYNVWAQNWGKCFGFEIIKNDENNYLTLYGMAKCPNLERDGNEPISCLKIEI
jgi:hypothetical protein